MRGEERLVKSKDGGETCVEGRCALAGSMFLVSW